MIYLSLQNLLPLFTMGLLDHVWDDTVVGPPPENDLGKLRKHHTFAFRSASAKDIGPIFPELHKTEGGSMRSYDEDAVRVTRSIMIVKPPGQLQSPTEFASASPAGSTPPMSPFSGAREPFRFRRRSTSDAYEKKGQNKSSPKSPFDV